MKFREMYDFIQEVKKKDHPGGTYICAKVSKKSREQMQKWVNEYNIPNAADPKQYHTTIVYSRKGIPEVTEYKIDFPIEASIKGWEIFNSGEKKCLVAVVDCPELTKCHEEIRKKYGATHDYPDYHPHITVSYDYGNAKVPDVVPDFKITYTSSQIEPLDLEYTA